MDAQSRLESRSQSAPACPGTDCEVTMFASRDLTIARLSPA
jgi:hypothetical protein